MSFDKERATMARATRAPKGAPKPTPAAATNLPMPAVTGVPSTIEGPPAKLEPVVHLDRAQREARGKAARAEVPRSAHAVWDPPAARTDPLAILEEQATTRLPDLLPIRYGRMSASPFAFYRGGAAIMAADLAGTPRSGLNAQLCGDAHLANFGAFSAPDRTLIFDLNDFDETLPGPWEFDVKRMAVSFEIMGRDRGFSASDRAELVRNVVASYREAMRSFVPLTNLDVWYARLDIGAAIEALSAQAPKKLAAQAAKTLDKARRKDSLRALDRLTICEDGKRRIASNPPLLVPIHELLPGVDGQELDKELRRIVRAYRQSLSNDRRLLLEAYRYVDTGRKVVGVGSVGTRAWIVLLTGVDEQDPLVLQVKEANASVLERFVGRSRYHHHGQRVVEGQRLMQAASDIMLGWVRIRGVDGVSRDFYVRQLWDGKGSVDLETMQLPGAHVYGQLCGWTLARAHARSGDRLAIAAYLGKGDAFDRALASFASAYADQNERDHAALVAAIAAGRIEAESGI
jgi:uncharacterized protein (DUF2252 family)